MGAKYDICEISVVVVCLYNMQSKYTTYLQKYKKKKTYIYIYCTARIRLRWLVHFVRLFTSYIVFACFLNIHFYVLDEENNCFSLKSENIIHFRSICNILVSYCKILSNCTGLTIAHYWKWLIQHGQLFRKKIHNFDFFSVPCQFLECKTPTILFRPKLSQSDFLASRFPDNFPTNYVPDETLIFAEIRAFIFFRSK